ncbi:hypothetical protein GCK72_006128 [Caenorhabditis remanei]|uniref:E3 SUMO-protein ligase NSE2 n=1 Tax=Caenorhabditis remanei TaxID=31234 RepID=A0A6A5HJU6_CAERE|nr:hypothetical protein GCK72_006128 [Caenorhabditis remanei]KAF1766172.1 hypothetical protein GCK72_006128 [Caenorhabditis remanei]
MAEFATGMRQIRKTIKKSAEDIAYMSSKGGFNNDQVKTTMIDTYVEMVEEMQKLDKEGQKLEEIIEVLINDLKDLDDDDDVPTRSRYDQLYKEVAKGKKNVAGDKQFFKDILRGIRNEDDETEDGEEMEVMQVQHSRKDPISKKDIVNPVINEACSHVYDRDSIYEFAGKKRSIKCAMQGCSETITLSKLINYPEYWNNIKQQQ